MIDEVADTSGDDTNDNTPRKAERTVPREISHPFQTDPDKPPVLQPPRPFEQGLVSVYYGNGKGKTSSAIGVAVRAAGYGLRVLFVQFMKGDERYGEQVFFAENEHVHVHKYGPEWFVDMNNVTEEEKQPSRDALAFVRDQMAAGNYDVIIMDEINVAARWKLIETQDVVDLIKAKPYAVELILTGRYAPAEFRDLADYVTEFKEEKHPYQRGIIARKGIDY